MLPFDDPIQKYRINTKSLIYNSRKDVEAIKNKILNEVNNPEYWNTLAQFIYGQISKDEYDKKMDYFLFTNELKLLHNEFLRGILFNAHFSSTPPPKVTVPKREHVHVTKNYMPPMPKPKNLEIKTFTAFDMMHLPSIYQLNERIRFILYVKSIKLKLDPDVAYQLQKSLFVFISQILQECLSLTNSSFSLSESALIQPQHLVHIFYNGSLLSKILSDEVITKYTSMLS